LNGLNGIDPLNPLNPRLTFVGRHAARQLVAIDQFVRPALPGEACGNRPRFALDRVCRALEKAGIGPVEFEYEPVAAGDM
jgi:hypothetical protein